MAAFAAMTGRKRGMGLDSQKFFAELFNKKATAFFQSLNSVRLDIVVSHG
jgi:hypothetical protein